MPPRTVFNASLRSHHALKIVSLSAALLFAHSFYQEFSKQLKIERTPPSGDDIGACLRAPDGSLAFPSPATLLAKNDMRPRGVHVPRLNGWVILHYLGVPVSFPLVGLRMVTWDGVKGEGEGKA